MTLEPFFLFFNARAKVRIQSRVNLHFTTTPDDTRGKTHGRARARTFDMAGTKNARGGKRAAKSEDDEAEEVEEDEEQRVVEDQPDDADADGNVDGNAEDEEERGDVGDGIEDRDDGGATAGRIPRDAAVVRDILKSMVRGADRGRRTRRCFLI